MAEQIANLAALRDRGVRTELLQQATNKPCPRLAGGASVDQLNRSPTLCAALQAANVFDGPNDEQDVIRCLVDVLSSFSSDSQDSALCQQVVDQIKVAFADQSASSPSHMVAFGPAPTESRLGLALSGGGTRAATFALGSILYLLDADRYGTVEQINSVSGGSLTNGYIANTTRSDQPITVDQLRPFARRLVDKGAPLEDYGRQFAFRLAISAVSALAAVATGVFALRGSLPWWVPVLLIGLAVYTAAILWYLLVLGTNEMMELWVRRTLNPT